MNKRKAIGIDFGGTVVKVALVDTTGTVLKSVRFHTVTAKTYEAWFRRVEKIITRFLNEHNDIAGIGIGIPGFVDFKKGFVYQVTNLDGWKNIPIAVQMKKRFHLPVFVDNDANAFALGECTFGAGRGYQHAVFVTLGTGVGGAIYINGSLYRGAFSMAGELGHVSIRMNGHKTSEGKGGVETYVGINAVTKYALHAIQTGRHSLLEKLAKGNLTSITPKLIALAARKRDSLAIEVFDKAADCLATALASVTYLIQPEVFIVGGGIAQSGNVLFSPLKKHLAERLNPIFADRILVIPATLKNQAGMIGSATLVFKHL